MAVDVVDMEIGKELRGIIQIPAIGLACVGGRIALRQQHVEKTVDQCPRFRRYPRV